MKPFKDRNLPVLGVLATAVVGLCVVTALNADKLPFLGGGGTTYAADFAEAAGLTDSAEVRVTGAKVGTVDRVSLDGDHIRVEFTVRGVAIGDQSTASIEVKTLLGQKYLSVSPAGGSPQDPRTPIPRDRTRVPYDLSPVLNDLSTTVGQIDTGKLAQSFQVLSETFAGSSPQVRGTLDGLSRLSETISSRDSQLATLLHNTRQVSSALGSRDEQFRKLLTDGNALLTEVQHRKDAIDRMLTATVSLSAQLHGVIADNQSQLGPALGELDKVTALLQRNQDNLAQGLHNLAPFARLSANVLGSGRWFDVYMCGLLPPTAGAGPLSVNPQGCQPPSAKGAGK
ncbi:MCE family protein [Amycolatopsis orientalis]|uniref:MCE family protein n=1 Tax=Amycolatopsis orientalis TaxID=31958 RepID=UPI0003AAAE82|nr:MCE family protein [Amycolatopsis orientalis]